MKEGDNRVPDFFDTEEDDYRISNSRTTKGENDIMELTWQNGNIVAQRSSKKTSFVGGGEAVILAEQAAERDEIHHHHQQQHQQQQQQQHLFMHEDEMASFLQYNLDESSFDRDLYADFLYTPPVPPAPPQPPQPPPQVSLPPPPAPPTVAQKSGITPRSQNFTHFSRIPIRPRVEPPTVRESTIVESNETPAVRLESRVSHTVAESILQSRMNTETTTAEDRKRKSRETDDNESHSEEIEFEATEVKKQARGSASTRRTRAAEVHNLSERRRRDRINEKMKALQELIPRCNKSDKASMLDEAIEYLKSLQLQVQMMSMGCGMVPMMYPGMQQYMPQMGMGMGMGMNMNMGMGMDMSMNRPMVPYPSMVPASANPNPAAAAAAAAAQMGSRFPIAPFHMQPPRVQSYNQSNLTNPVVANNPNQPQMQNFLDPYQQFIGLHQAQIPVPQNQAVMPPSAKNPSASKETANNGHQQTGGQG